MAKICYQHIRLRGDSHARIRQANEIIEEYAERAQLQQVSDRWEGVQAYIATEEGGS